MTDDNAEDQRAADRLPPYTFPGRCGACGRIGEIRVHFCRACALVEAGDPLQATRDIRKVSLWLGHAHQSTTEIYLQVDPTEKIAAVESSVPLRLRPGRFRPSDRLIASLMPGKTPLPPAHG